MSCLNERNTCHSRRVATTSVIPGRRSGSSCQHWTVISQTGSVNFSACGRSGISRFMIILKTASAGASSLNGWLPVKTLSRFSRRQPLIPLRPMLGTGMRGTDLYDNYAKCIDIRLPRIHTISPDHLRCGPPRCKPLYAGYKYRVQSTNNGGKAEIGQTSTATVVDENVELVGVR